MRWVGIVVGVEWGQGAACGGCSSRAELGKAVEGVLVEWVWPPWVKGANRGSSNIVCPPPRALETLLDPPELMGGGRDEGGGTAQWTQFGRSCSLLIHAMKH